ncbi:protein ABHD1 [Spea bombifrons]|uniref:protein ABHD1 n=1 Tax=Spea bombifrons TaxID=233779 RepID=UPI00234BE999|nr:protein ABHD1 [Spea bombifrons]
MQEGDLRQSRTPAVSCVLLGIGAACLYYYFRRVCKVPRLVCASPLRNFLETHCPVLKDEYRPTFWCHEGRLQTVFRVLFVSRPHVSYRNEILPTSDGGQISLDWVDNRGSCQFPDGSSRPTIIFLPGLTGSSHQTYMLHLVIQASRDGYRSVVFNNRGFGGEKLLTPRTFCAANTEDLHRVIGHVRCTLPAAPLLAVGVSLGGMTLLNYLSATGDASQLCAAISVSTPWNVFVSTESLEKPLNYLLFNQTLVRGIKRTVEKHRDVIGQVVDVDYVLQSRSIREFDERFTAPLFGFQSCDEYYRNASPCHKLGGISTPTLCLNASDDPFSPREALPLDAVSSHPSVALLITRHGGHIGFLEGLFPNHQRYMDRVFSQFAESVFRHGEELSAVTTRLPGEHPL